MVPCAIRSHLVPFLFEQFEGRKASYQGFEVSFVKFSPSSSIANYLYNLTDYKKQRGKQDSFVLYLSIQKKEKFSYSGIVYIDKKGFKEKLMLEEEKVKSFNNLLEDIFRVSLVFHVNACVKSGITVQNAIEIFVKEYDLEENGLDAESLRQLYYRVDQSNLFARLQKQSSNRVSNY
jgi:hypothetical protein